VLFIEFIFLMLGGVPDDTEWSNFTQEVRIGLNLNPLGSPNSQNVTIVGGSSVVTKIDPKLFSVTTSPEWWNRMVCISVSFLFCALKLMLSSLIAGVEFGGVYARLVGPV